MRALTMDSSPPAAAHDYPQRKPAAYGLMGTATDSKDLQSFFAFGMPEASPYASPPTLHSRLLPVFPLTTGEF